MAHARRFVCLAVVLLFVLLSPVVRASLGHSLDRAQSAEFTYENHERYLMAIDQMKSLISEF